MTLSSQVVPRKSYKKCQSNWTGKAQKLKGQQNKIKFMKSKDLHCDGIKLGEELTEEEERYVHLEHIVRMENDLKEKCLKDTGNHTTLQEKR